VSWLVDANVLSEPTRPRPDPQVVDWLRRHEAAIRVDPVILGELRYGILLLPSGARRKRLLDWFDGGVRRIRCLDWDAEVGLRWAKLLADLRASGSAMPVKDSLIAATALHHGLAVATRNTRDFARAGIEVLDPFA
jgi:toxin FitB